MKSNSVTRGRTQIQKSWRIAYQEYGIATNVGIFGNLVERMDCGNEGIPLLCLDHPPPFLHLVGCALEEGKTVLILETRKSRYLLRLFKLYCLYFGLWMSIREMTIIWGTRGYWPVIDFLLKQHLPCLAHSSVPWDSHGKSYGQPKEMRRLCFYKCIYENIALNFVGAQASC
jgi:hypothetical protein